MSNHIVFLHGFLGNDHEFDPIISRLKNNYTCVAIDLNLAPQYDLLSMAKFVREELSKRNITKSHFWGYSMGGRVLLEFYKNFPEVCFSLTLESTSLGLVDPHERDNRVKMDSDWAKLIENDPELFLEKWYSQNLFAGFKRHNGFAGYLELREKTLSHRHSQMILEASPGANSPHFEVIDSLDLPTLALVGQNDEKYLRIWGKLIDKNPKIAVSNIVLEAIENSGHVVHLENPHRAVEIFLKFMKEHI
jgi:2-succinyl-6-hydroxy-2,4-cyclohexadiene-1-carboxylate synthase